MLQDGRNKLAKQIEEVRMALNYLTCEENRILYDEQILKVSRQLDTLIVRYMIN